MIPRIDLFAARGLALVALIATCLAPAVFGGTVLLLAGAPSLADSGAAIELSFLASKLFVALACLALVAALRARSAHTVYGIDRSWSATCARIAFSIAALEVAIVILAVALMAIQVSGVLRS